MADDIGDTAELDDSDDITELDDPDPDPDDDEVVRAKGVMDGSTTLSEAAAALRGFADFLVRLEADGWQFSDRVEDDYGFLRRVRPAGGGGNVSPAGPNGQR